MMVFIISSVFLLWFSFVGSPITLISYFFACFQYLSLPIKSFLSLSCFKILSAFYLKACSVTLFAKVSLISVFISKIIFPSISNF